MESRAVAAVVCTGGTTRCRDECSAGLLHRPLHMWAALNGALTPAVRRLRSRGPRTPGGPAFAAFLRWRPPAALGATKRRLYEMAGRSDRLDGYARDRSTSAGRCRSRAPSSCRVLRRPDRIPVHLNLAEGAYVATDHERRSPRTPLGPWMLPRRHRCTNRLAHHLYRVAPTRKRGSTAPSTCRRPTPRFRSRHPLLRSSADAPSACGGDRGPPAWPQRPPTVPGTDYPRDACRECTPRPAFPMTDLNQEITHAGCRTSSP